jgi:hypothetical protein
MRSISRLPLSSSFLSVQLQALGCPDPADLWTDLWDLLPPAAPARSRVRLALHVDFFDADSVRTLRALAPGSLYFLQVSPCSRRDAVCSVLAAFVLLVGASVADAAVALGSCMVSSGPVRRSLSAIVLPPAPRLAGSCPLSFRPARGAEAEVPLG